MAALWQGLVCRMYDDDRWELDEGGNTYVRLGRASNLGFDDMLLTLLAIGVV